MKNTRILAPIAENFLTDYLVVELMASAISHFVVWIIVWLLIGRFANRKCVDNFAKNIWSILVIADFLYGVIG